MHPTISAVAVTVQSMVRPHCGYHHMIIIDESDEALLATEKLVAHRVLLLVSFVAVFVSRVVVSLAPQPFCYVAHC